MKNTKQNKLNDLLLKLSSAYQENAIESEIESIKEYHYTKQDFADAVCENYRQTLKGVCNDVYKGFRLYGDETELQAIAFEVYDLMTQNANKGKTKQSRIDKTIKATFSLYGCDPKNTKINAILRDNENGDLIVFFTRTKHNYTDEFDPTPRTLKLTEYVSFNSRYVWGVRVGFFCGIKEELKHFENTRHYTRVK